MNTNFRIRRIVVIIATLLTLAFWATFAYVVITATQADASTTTVSKQIRKAPRAGTTPTTYPTLYAGTPLYEDNLNTHTKGGWPTINARYSNGGAVFSATTTNPTTWVPAVSATKYTDVAVIAELKGTGTDTYGTVCRHGAGMYYAFVVQGTTWSIYRGTVRMATGTVATAAPYYTVGGDCWNNNGTADLRISVNGKELGRVVDRLPLTGTGTGIYFRSSTGTSTLAATRFAVYSVGM